MLCALGGWILYIFEAAHGLGHSDAWFDAGNGDEQKITQGTFWQSIVCSSLGMAMLKISIALNLLRLSPARWYVYCLWGSIVIVIAYCFLGAMAFFLYCSPMSAYWTQAPGSHCYPVSLFVTFALVNTSFNIFTDVLFATIPIPIIWTLKMRRKVRFYLIGILSLGYVAVIFGVMNAVYQIAFPSTTDEYLDDWILFWATAQFNVGILAACIPSLKPIVSTVLKLSDYSNSYPPSRNIYGTRSRSRRVPTNTGGSTHTVGGGGGNRIWSLHRGDQYALQELGSRDSGDRGHEHHPNGEYSATITYDEPWPLPRDLHQQSKGVEDGIVKTTEVIVN
ncbi:uncharacterized protein N7484_001449 [Penicillium longicatenatum]|uniref:uncharacterized protein n=1 Tax=Penicillium longicatenatum TaxID=1561947 RepID=UPI0025469EAA|nr:uncharacterized protein N7484_001449 [Penicillium longicatenatum]KAJ5657800.1 hypothetical protein N7484_001449 [Penicillium longicatenatum]